MRYIEWLNTKRGHYVVKAELPDALHVEVYVEREWQDGYARMTPFGIIGWDAVFGHQPMPLDYFELSDEDQQMVDHAVSRAEEEYNDVFTRY